MSYSQNDLQKIWEKGSPVKGKNPELYRRDVNGDMMYKPSYGKTSEMGWEVDHKNPKANGGTDSMRNYQPMNWKGNRQKSNKY